MADTTELLDDEMIDPVMGEAIDQKDLAERLLAQAKEQGVSLVGNAEASVDSRTALIGSIGVGRMKSCR
ncbi:hypothetical protein [Microbacterium sp.]|uniref:hypothetical protein n=1 Tax=Microbacterium sp. TaxID=51671 RepID=UPI003F9B3500